MFKESSKRCLIFSYLFAAFEKPLNISRQELSFNHIFKKCLISKDLLVIRKNAGIVLIGFDQHLFELSR